MLWGSGIGQIVFTQRRKAGKGLAAIFASNLTFFPFQIIVACCSSAFFHLSIRFFAITDRATARRIPLVRGGEHAGHFTDDAA
jgi:SNF family Na+-dependent transporter